MESESRTCHGILGYQLHAAAAGSVISDATTCDMLLGVVEGVDIMMG